MGVLQHTFLIDLLFAINSIQSSRYLQWIIGMMHNTS